MPTEELSELTLGKWKYVIKHAGRCLAVFVAAHVVTCTCKHTYVHMYVHMSCMNALR